jgi:diguanylate cyclase (GGDEF)-like protein
MVDSAGLIIGAVDVISNRTEKIIIELRIGELESLAFRDALTGVPSRRYVEPKIKQAIQEVEPFDKRDGLLRIDIDHFNQINDSFGHDICDDALKAVCQTLTHALRSGDTTGRWGGEEYPMIATDVNEHPLVTISLGATLIKAGDTDQSVIKTRMS